MESIFIIILVPLLSLCKFLDFNYFFMKQTYLFIFFFFCLIIGKSQKSLNLTINISEVSDKSGILIKYFNGLVDINISDSFHNNILLIKEPFFSEFVPIEITYKLKTGGNDQRIFFANDTKSNITLINSQDSIKKRFDFKFKNVRLITDTTYNPVYRDLQKARTEAAKPIDDLWEKYQGAVMTEDSLHNKFLEYYKILNQSSLDFLKLHSKDYFSLWYFGFQVINPSISLFRSDTIYLKYLLKYFSSTFPKRYLESYEGKYYIQTLTGIINPPTENNPAPFFSKKDVSGKIQSLNSLKGKIILLDFWASWCSPCLASIPKLQALKNKYSKDNFEIIGINLDRNLITLKKTCISKKMDWSQIQDLDNSIQNKYGVFKIPTLILIDKAGKIILKSTGLEDNNSLEIKLNSLLKSDIKPK